MATIALVDDHPVVRNSLKIVLQSAGHEIVLEASNGDEFINRLNGYEPDLVLLDIQMPKKNGYETARWITEQHPATKILALTMLTDENSIIRMLRSGAKGYIMKDAELEEIEEAINAVLNKGYYYSQHVTSKVVKAIGSKKEDPAAKLSKREIEFLQHCCSELTYKEIAAKMGISTHTVETMRVNLCDKLELSSRIGLAMYAIQNAIYSFFM